MYAKITRDKFYESDPAFAARTGLVSRAGQIIVSGVHTTGGLLDVRLLDDDREVMYYAAADDDALETLFDWAQGDVGCTILQVLDADDGWKDVIS